MICARCGTEIIGGPSCDYHERGCTTDTCWCDTTQVVHRRCCERCTRPAHLCKRAV